MIDIAQENVLVDYLYDKKLIQDKKNTSVTYFGGGVSGVVALVKENDSLFIAKQALAKLKVKADWFSDPSRMRIEKDANEVYNRLAPDCTPRVFFYDGENYIYVREAARESCVMWKTQLLEGLIDFEVAKQAITSLRMVHENCAKDKEIAALFKDKSFFYDLRISPYIEQVVKVHPQLASFAQPVIQLLMESDQTLIHGDYSPKNILVDGRRICILDFEVAHLGHASFDIAFFINHFILKAVYKPEFASAYLNLVSYMLSVYFDGISFTDKNTLMKESVAVWALLFLARVDGKSPVEYLAGFEDKKQLVRNIAFTVINEKYTTFAEVLCLVQKENDKITSM